MPTMPQQSVQDSDEKLSQADLQVLAQLRQLRSRNSKAKILSLVKFAEEATDVLRTYANTLDSRGESEDAARAQEQAQAQAQ